MAMKRWVTVTLSDEAVELLRDLLEGYDAPYGSDEADLADDIYDALFHAEPGVMLVYPEG